MRERRVFTSINAGIYHESRACAERRSYVGPPYAWRTLTELIARHPFIRPCSACVTWHLEGRMRHARALLRRCSPNFAALFFSGAPESPK